MLRIDRIQTLMQQRRLTYQELADATGLHQPVIHRYCTGGTKSVPADRVRLIAKALGTTPEYIMGVDDEDAMSQDERELVAAYKSLSPENRQLMDSLLERLLASQGK